MFSSADAGGQTTDVASVVREVSATEEFRTTDGSSGDSAESVLRQDTCLPVVGSPPEISSSSSSSSSSDSMTSMDVNKAFDTVDQSSYMNLRHKCNRKTVQERSRPKRETARSMCRPLKQWLYGHRDRPYPSKAEKMELATRSDMTLVQVSNWFANARRRLKNTVSSGSWSRRIKLYNRNIVGNQELLSISSEDDDDDEEEDDEEEEEEEEGVGDGRVKIDPCKSENGDGKSFDSCIPTSLSSSFFYQQLSSSAYRAELRVNDSVSSPQTSDSAPLGGGGVLLLQRGVDRSRTHQPGGKFKQGILQQYLNDSFHLNLIAAAGCGSGGAASIVAGGSEMNNRLRNASGSLSSHDYEEELSVSSRSTPVQEHRAMKTIEDDLEESSAEDNYHGCAEQSEESNELSWKEMSAVRALVALADRTRRQRQA